MAHELRPAFLDIRETGVDEFAVTWKVPALGDRSLGLYVRLPKTCTTQGDVIGTFENAAYLQRWTARCPGGLEGQEILVEGLRTTLTDALARIAYRDGSIQSVRITPDEPSFTASGSQSTLGLARTYLALGTEHILTGIDHLLFVFALMLLVHDRWTLIKTVTAFTIAHSMTLAGSALGYLSLSQKPVEAAIALSIAFVASEIVKARPGELRVSQTAPWIVAFAFGLLHGFGFAGALREIGLPQHDVPIALLLFNVGVEIGQLIFVAAIWLALAAAGRLVKLPADPTRIAAGYVIGTISATWLVFRLSTF